MQPPSRGDATSPYASSPYARYAEAPLFASAPAPAFDARLAALYGPPRLTFLEPFLEPFLEHGAAVFERAPPYNTVDYHAALSCLSRVERPAVAETDDPTGPTFATCEEAF